MNEYTFRPVELPDVPAVQALVSQVLVEYGLPPDHSGTDADLAGLPSSYTASGGVFLVAEDALHKIVGTGGLFPLREGVAEIRKMYFLPEARGKGYGRKMLQQLIEEARRLKFNRLELETANVLKEAIGLYKSVGFRPTGTQPEVRRCDQVLFLDLS